MSAQHQGLTSREAAELLEKWGSNEPIERRYAAVFREAAKILFDPMTFMLVALGGLYWLLGDMTDAIIITAALVPVTLVNVVLELRTERALRALKGTLTPFATVMRDGALKKLPISKLVPGDLLVFEEGQTLGADGEVVEAADLSVNQSSLTGESVPINKNEGDPFWAGTSIIAGRGLGRITATGPRTRFGSVARMMEQVKTGRSPLQKRVDRVVRVAVVAAVMVSVALFFLEWRRTGELINSLIVAITLGMAAVPEEFPLVYTLYLSLGAWRLSKIGVLVKSLPSVETLGGVDVICTDKTGTLTEGSFQLTELKNVTDGGVSDDKLAVTALMACEPHPVDALERAIFNKIGDFQTNLKNWKLAFDYPFDPEGKHMSHVWRDPSGQCVVAMKGAVEGVLEHCASADRERWLDEGSRLASKGFRVLGLARRDGPCFGERKRDEAGMAFAGFLIFSDPVRSTVREAVKHCQDAGIEIKMLTGDHLLTAHAVADQTGITHAHDLIFSSGQLNKMTSEQRRDAYQKGAIFARVTPEEKFEMVEALKEEGKVVAMTGDGINDAPALKLADIGISMGAKATDVARSAAQMILMKDDFSGIVASVFEGRKIFGNLRRSFSYLVSFHVPVVLLAMIPPFLGWDPLLLPIHVIMLELVVHPVSAFSFENRKREGEDNRRNPESLLSSKQAAIAAAAGLFVSIGALILFRHFNSRAAAFASVLFGNFFFILAETWPVINRRVVITLTILFGVTAAITGVPPLMKLLSFGPITATQLGTAFAVGAVSSAFRIFVR